MVDPVFKGLFKYQVVDNGLSLWIWTNEEFRYNYGIPEDWRHHDRCGGCEMKVLWLRKWEMDSPNGEDLSITRKIPNSSGHLQQRFVTQLTRRIGSSWLSHGSR